MAKRQVSKDFRQKLAAFEHPSLQWSSDSSSVDDCEIIASRKSNLMDQAHEEEEGHAHATASVDTRRLLQTAAALHFGDGNVPQKRNMWRSTSVLETRSTLSSPGKTNVTLREKLRRMSSTQRKELLTTRSSSNKAAYDNETIDECLEEEMTVRSSRELDEALVRLERHNIYNTHRVVRSSRRTNSIQLHIYDLLTEDALMQLPWGFVCEIGKCFNEVNTALHELGTGAYHVGIEVNGIEYAYGATNIPGKSGVFSCIPKLSPGYQYRTTIDFGEHPLVRNNWVPITTEGEENERSSTVYKKVEEYIDGEEVIKEMAKEYMGIDYDILRKNCCSFARDACIRLGIPESDIPAWFSNLAESGASTRDLALDTFEPIHGILSGCEDDTVEKDIIVSEDSGFEVVAKRKENNEEVLVVIESKPRAPSPGSVTEIPHVGLYRTLSWTY